MPPGDEWTDANLPDDAGAPLELRDLELLIDDAVVWTIHEDRLPSARRWHDPEGLPMVTVDVLDQDRALSRSSGVLPNIDPHEPVPQAVIAGRRFTLARMRWRGQVAVMVLTFQELR